MTPVQTQIIDARKWPIVLIYILTGGPFFIYLKLTGDPKGISDFMIPITLILPIAFYIAVSKMKIIIDNETLTFKTLFKTKEIKWKDIDSSRLSFEVHSHSSDVKWIFRDKMQNELSFSPSYFSRKDNRIIADTLVSKCIFTNISDKVRNMALGKFPWYIF